MQLILYYAPNACSLVPYVTLTEAGAPFEVHPLNFRKSQHMTPEYLRLNPKHKVPVLVIDGDHDEAIKREHTEYIAATIPAARLVILPDVSHFAFLQDPSGFNVALLEFLDR